MDRIIIYIKDLFFNLLLSHRCDLFYVVENHNWVTDSEWGSISNSLNNLGLIRSKTTSTTIGLRSKTIHFGSIGTFVTKRGLKMVHKSNRIILTWFHVVDNDYRLKYIPDVNSRVSFIHTACQITKEKLIKAGVLADKIVLIPLGIDLNIFKKLDGNFINNFKHSLGISEQAIVIGSFQKDGNGWGVGDTPKLIKGPDIFCDVVQELSKKYPLHIILTGPARGYVKNRLSSAGIKFSHVYLNHLEDIVSYYNILDLYLVCSREEGGPKAILESLACGVPLITTKVGMSPEVIKEGWNGYLTNIDDKIKLIDCAEMIINKKIDVALMIKNGLETVQKYSFSLIVQSYTKQIYSRLIK